MYFLNIVYDIMSWYGDKVSSIVPGAPTQYYLYDNSGTLYEGTSGNTLTEEG